MISVFVATSGRPAMFRDMLESLLETTQEYDLEVVAVIDDDPMANDYAAEYHVRVDYGPERRGASWAWNRGLQMSIGDILIPAGDDQIFHPNWLEYALESHRERLGGSGVVGMNDLAYDGDKQVATMWLFDRTYCKVHMGGIFAPPCYAYYCVDSEWNEKAKMLGRFYWDERSVVEHLHSAHGKRPLDRNDQEKMDAHWMEVDNQTFRYRKAQGFPVTWEPLI